MKNYIDKVHTWGRIWTVSALLFMLAVPLAISVYFDAWPEASGLFNGLLRVLPLFWATAVIEVVSYAPILGAGGAYLSFVTGNITNLKLPCALAAMESAKVQPNTEEGEVITTIAVASSATTGTRGARAASCARIYASAAWSACVTGESSAFWRTSTLPP